MPGSLFLSPPTLSVYILRYTQLNLHYFNPYPYSYKLPLSFLLGFAFLLFDFLSVSYISIMVSNTDEISRSVLFVAVLGLHCCMSFSPAVASGGSSSCSVWASHYSGFSCCWAQALGVRASVVARGLSSTSSVVVVQGWILYHWATREVPQVAF